MEMRYIVDISAVEPLSFGFKYDSRMQGRKETTSVRERRKQKSERIRT